MLLINKYIGILDEDFSKISSITINGADNDEFIFERKLNVEKIPQYLESILRKYYDLKKVSKQQGKTKDLISLYDLIICFCYFPSTLNDNKNMQELMDELENVKSLKINIQNDIYYKNKDKKVKLRNQSPGSKANILMEYIVFKETSIPLLIDQPEDNIDNHNIYNDLTRWMYDLKQKRQVIVVTHDPNIVVNSDSENVVLCLQNSIDSFTYFNGALEFNNMLNDVSEILDGGKEAIKRRLIKYGE